MSALDRDEIRPRLAGRRATLLVVAGEGVARVSLAEALADLGHAVLEAPDAAGAAALLRSGAPIDLVVAEASEGEVPGGEAPGGEAFGTGLARRIGAGRPRLPLVLIGDATADEANEALPPGVARLRRPCRPPVLRDAIEAALRARDGVPARRLAFA